jgi:hypothetical protein
MNAPRAVRGLTFLHSLGVPRTRHIRYHAYLPKGRLPDVHSQTFVPLVLTTGNVEKFGKERTNAQERQLACRSLGTEEAGLRRTLS